MDGWYYLHTNGDLIYKSDSPGMSADIRESSFARALWPINTKNRANAWQVLVEALAIGANKARVDELAKKWGCDNDDAMHYAEYLGVGLEMDGDKWCATTPGFINLQESPAGFGDTCLEALADLAKGLGFKGGKMWNATFKSLLSRSVSENKK